MPPLIARTRRAGGSWFAPRVVLGVALGAALVALPVAAQSPEGGRCRGTVYLTLDTGNMSQAELIAGILQRHKVRATFFLANEKTPRGDFALDQGWADYWRARAGEGHAFGSHTFDHVYFADDARGADGMPVTRVRPQFGDSAGKQLLWDGAAICRELRRVEQRMLTMTGRGLDPIWRAPGGRANATVVDAAQRCGYAHVPWAAAGFLGDELPSERFPNRQLLDKALREIGDGDILLAHLGIWSRRDPFAPMLDPLIAGLKARGLCFATIAEHPRYRGQPGAAR